MDSFGRFYRPNAVDSFVKQNIVLCFTATITLALALRIAKIDYSLSTDEIASFNFAELPLSQLWSSWIAIESNPPLYYSILKIWQFCFGTSDVTSRILSVVAGLMGLPVLFFLGRSVAGSGVGLLTMAYVAVSPSHIMFSQQVRGYIFSFGFASLALLGVVLFLKNFTNVKTRISSLFVYSVATIGAVYCHTTMVFLPIAASTFMIGWAFSGVPAADRVRFLAHWFAAQAVVLIAWAWWGSITLKQMLNPSDNIQWIPEPTVLDALAMTLRSYAPPGVEFGSAIVATAAFLLFTVPTILLFIRGSLTRRTGPTLLMTFVALAVPACLFALSQIVPVFLPRTVFWASSAFAVIVAVGLASIRTTPLRHACIAAGLLGTLAASLAVNNRFELEPWKRIVATIQDFEPQATVIAGNRTVAMNLRRYCLPPECQLDIREIAETLPWNREFAGAPEIRPADIAALLADRDTLVAVSRGVGGAEDYLQPVGRQGEPLAVRIPPHLRITVWTSN